MTARELVEACRDRGATLVVEGGRMKVRASAPLSDGLLAELRAHRDELLAELERPLALEDADALVSATFGEVVSWYAEGALGELNIDPALAARLDATERAIDSAVAAGPTAAGLRKALAQHIEVIRECVRRHAHRLGLCNHAVEAGLVEWYQEHPERWCARCWADVKTPDPTAARRRSPT